MEDVRAIRNVSYQYIQKREITWVCKIVVGLETTSFTTGKNQKNYETGRGGEND